MAEPASSRGKPVGSGPTTSRSELQPPIQKAAKKIRPTGAGDRNRDLMRRVLREETDTDPPGAAAEEKTDVSLIGGVRQRYRPVPCCQRRVQRGCQAKGVTSCQ